MNSAKSNSVHYATYGSAASNKPFADALLGFQPEVTAGVLPEKPGEQKKSSVSAKKKQSRVPFKKETSVAPSRSNEPSAQVVEVEKNNLSNTQPRSQVSVEPSPGNVSIGRLFLDHKILLQFLNELHEKQEKAICTFFQQKKSESKDGKIVRSFLALRVVVRPGSRIALCVTHGGTGWLAKRFPIGVEFFLDELLCQREAPEERKAATLVLRMIMDDVRAVRAARRTNKTGK